MRLSHALLRQVYNDESCMACDGSYLDNELGWYLLEQSEHCGNDPYTWNFCDFWWEQQYEQQEQEQQEHEQEEHQQQPPADAENGSNVGSNKADCRNKTMHTDNNSNGSMKATTPTVAKENDDKDSRWKLLVVFIVFAFLLLPLAAYAWRLFSHLKQAKTKNKNVVSKTTNVNEHEATLDTDEDGSDGKP